MNTIGIIVFQNHYKYIMDSFTHKRSNYHFDKIIVDKVLQKFTNNSSIFLLYQVEWVKEILILLNSNFHKNKPKVRGTFLLLIILLIERLKRSILESKWHIREVVVNNTYIISFHIMGIR